MESSEKLSWIASDVDFTARPWPRMLRTQLSCCDRASIWDFSLRAFHRVASFGLILTGPPGFCRHSIG